MLDFSHDVYGSFPLMLALIALATFVLLARAFRSIVLPLKAVAMNLASLGAAYGVMVWIWQHGHGSQAIWGIPATGAITMWVPLMVFAFLFGLSMDYEVFILARMREAYDRTGDTRAAARQFTEVLPLGMQPVRGIAAPVEVYMLTGLLSAPASGVFQLQRSARVQTFPAGDRPDWSWGDMFLPTILDRDRHLPKRRCRRSDRRIEE